MKTELTQERKRIKIAEACGIVVYEEQDGSGLWSSKTSYKTGISKEHAERVSIPEYFNDLNACNEMEKVLKEMRQCSRFAQELAVLVKGFAHDPFLGVSSYVWHATAEQRAEAFGKTLGLW